MYLFGCTVNPHLFKILYPSMPQMALLHDYSTVPDECADLTCEAPGSNGMTMPTPGGCECVCNDGFSGNLCDKGKWWLKQS